MSSSSENNCQATTSQGQPCRRPPTGESGLCWQHKKPILKIRKRIKISASSATTSAPKLKQRKKIKLSKQPKALGDTVTFFQHKSVFYFYHPANHKSNKVALFDLDDTLIKRGRPWTFAYPRVVDELQRLHQNGYYLGVISNKYRMHKGQVTVADMKKLFTEMFEKTKVPLDIFLLTNKDNYRKPLTDSWELIEPRVIRENLSGFYVGDAAGRKKPKDFNITDLYFAYNLDRLLQYPKVSKTFKVINFYVPEQVFKIGGENFVLPAELHYPYNIHVQPYYPREKITINQELPSKSVVIMIGPPACGKSHLSLTHLKDWTHLSTDYLGSLTKVKKLFLKELENGRPVVVDNTNRDKKTREWYLAQAKEKGYPVYAIWFDIPKDFAWHLNQFRVQSSHGQMKYIPKVVYHTYYKRLEPPVMEEGFKNIYQLTSLPLIPESPPNDAFDLYFNYYYDPK